MSNGFAGVLIWLSRLCRLGPFCLMGKTRSKLISFRLDPVRNHGFYEPDVIDRARKETYALFDVFDRVLHGRRYLVGDQLSIGDIMAACVVGRACEFVSVGLICMAMSKV